MIDLHLNHGNGHEGVFLRLPATPGEVGAAFGMLEKLGDGKVTIFDVSCPIQNISQYILSADVNDRDDLAKLQKLAQDINGMDRSERKVFSGALDAEPVNGLDDVLRIVHNLDQYILIHDVNNDKELGGFLVESGYKDFPERVRPYLDYAGIGAEYRAERGGAYTAAGYVLRREATHELAGEVEAVFRLHLHTDMGENAVLDLPATEERLEQAKRALRVEEFASARIAQVEMQPDIDGHIPADAICVQDANDLAITVDEMLQADDESLSKFLAVLSVEQPDTFPATLRLAMDLDDYELVPDDPWEYGERVLRRVCTDQEVLDTIDGFMDYKALGEFQMKEDGVRETEFGSIRRLSSPFPDPVQGQQMT